jgi:hypothetical protein
MTGFGLRMSENKMLRGLFGPGTEELTMNEDVANLYC